MKKDILNQFKNSLVSRALANTIVGGYFGSGGGGGGACVGGGCPMTGGFCNFKGNCTRDGKIFGAYECTVLGASQQYKDSVTTANPGQSFFFQATYTVTCTGYAGV